MGWRLIHYDRVTGVSEWHLYDEGKTHVRIMQDVEPILDHNQALSTHDAGWSPTKFMRRIGSIPDVVMNDFHKKGINLAHPAFEKERKKLFNDIDYRKLRSADWTV